MPKYWKCSICGANVEQGLTHTHNLTVPTIPPKLTGGSSDYYLVDIKNPTSGGPQYTAECNDIIEALGMTFAEGNIFKALWRSCQARLGTGKPGTSEIYDAEKIVFFGNRKLELARQKG